METDCSLFYVCRNKRVSSVRGQYMRRVRSIIMIPATIVLLLCFTSGPALAQEKKVVRISGGGALSDVVQSYSRVVHERSGELLHHRHRNDYWYRL